MHSKPPHYGFGRAGVSRLWHERRRDPHRFSRLDPRGHSSLFGLCRSPGTQTGVEPATVKLLFDHNLSYRLVRALQQEYSDSQHVREVGLSEATDEAVWRHAGVQGLTIVTKDSDFHQRSFLFGHPPKVV